MAKKITAERLEKDRIYDYSTEESRVATAEWLLMQAKKEKTAVKEKWRRCDDYYHFAHDVAREMADALEEMGLERSVAVVPDPYVMVESQIVPDVPQPEFHGRDAADRDDEKAYMRELAVRYVMEENRINDMNTSNERRLRKFGDAFWKAFYDARMPCGKQMGNIRIKDVSPFDIYPDPVAGAEDLQACEYVDYVYKMHKMRFAREFAKELKEKGLVLEDVTGDVYRVDLHDAEPYTMATTMLNDEVVVLEHWFRQPEDTKGAHAGDIACTIQAGGHELRYIPNYWQKTGRQCKLFPFVHSWCIRDEAQFWNMSELEPILPMVDAADRELMTGILNDAMMANDIVIEEDGALAPGEVMTNTPGATVKVNAGRINGVRRLGGLHDGVNSINMVNWLQDQIQRTNRNYDTTNGKETARVTTASGLLQLRADAETQQKIKRADRDNAFCRLYELIDWLTLEFFDDGRMLYIGAAKKGDTAATLEFNGDDLAVMVGEETDPMTGETLRAGYAYYPRVDVTVTCGDPISKNPMMTLETLDKIAASSVTAENWKIVAAELEYLDIPQKSEIIDEWKKRFEPTEVQQLMQALEKDPQLLSAVMEAVNASGSAQEAAGAQTAAMGGQADILPAMGAEAQLQAQDAMPML